VQGVIAGFPHAGVNLQPFAAIVHADLPVGGGLSSSAALEVAAATLLEAMTGTRLEPLQKALLCQKAEHDYARVPCGIMDQCSVIMGRTGSLLLLDCRSREAELVPLSDPDVLALIVNSNVKHALTDGGYAVRRKQCETAARFLGVAALRDVTMAQLEKSRTKLDEVLYRRARHVIGENERTLGTAQALKRGDWDTVGAHMAASHESLRRDYEVSCAELDVLVELAAQIGPAGGVVGARMTGGGFGGCTISLVRRWALEEVMTRIGAGYQQRTGRQASMFVTTPAAGARIIY
jgi:galactokinase